MKNFRSFARWPGGTDLYPNLTFDDHYTEEEAKGAAMKLATVGTATPSGKKVKPLETWVKDTRPIFIVCANPASSRRTKNRIKDHGDRFMVLDRGLCAAFPEVDCVLMQSVKTSWFGWLPEAEVTLVPQ